MAKGEEIPYQLRPNKFIDRQLFIDLLAQVCAAKGPNNYIYASMGGKHLVDQESIYRRVGIRNLFSFDKEDWIVRRQEKNAPHHQTICEQMEASALPGSVDTLASVFAPADSFVFWLDYTTAHRLAQLQELSQLLQKCQPGDVTRITLNSDPRTLGDDWKEEGFDNPGEYRADRLRKQLGGFYPSKITSVTEEEVPSVLAQAVSLAASEASRVTTHDYRPILLTTYTDGMRMLTVTMLTMDDPSQPLPDTLGCWEFTPASWVDLIDISAPDLSMREKILIDQHLGRPAHEVIEQIGFKIAKKDRAAVRAVESYQRLHRYYPTFYAIGIQ